MLKGYCKLFGEKKNHNRKTFHTVGNIISIKSIITAEILFYFFQMQLHAVIFVRLNSMRNQF